MYRTRELAFVVCETNCWTQHSDVFMRICTTLIHVLSVRLKQTFHLTTDGFRRRDMRAVALTILLSAVAAQLIVHHTQHTLLLLVTATWARLQSSKELQRLPYRTRLQYQAKSYSDYRIELVYNQAKSYSDYRIELVYNQAKSYSDYRIELVYHCAPVLYTWKPVNAND